MEGNVPALDVVTVKYNQIHYNFNLTHGRLFRTDDDDDIANASNANRMVKLNFWILFDYTFLSIPWLCIAKYLLLTVL